MKYYIITFALILFSCSDSSEQEPDITSVAKVFDLTTTDYGNNENSSDMYVSFKVPRITTGLKELRVIISKIETQVSLTTF